MRRRLFTSSVSRLRRSVLYMPASNERALEKAKTIPADGFIFDLEDAVAPSSKNEARERAVKAANSKSYGNSEVIIRINGIDTEWFEEDVAAVCTSDADAVLLPKTNSSDDVETLRDEMSKHSTKEMDIWCMIETPKGVSEAMKIASRDDVTCLCMGTVDLANDLHCNPSVHGVRARSENFNHLTQILTLEHRYPNVGIFRWRCKHASCLHVQTISLLWTAFSLIFKTRKDFVRNVCRDEILDLTERPLSIPT